VAENRAWILAQAGDAGAALDEIEQLLAAHPMLACTRWSSTRAGARSANARGSRRYW
jgi:hypothetical protein